MTITIEATGRLARLFTALGLYNKREERVSARVEEREVRASKFGALYAAHARYMGNYGPCGMPDRRVCIDCGKDEGELGVGNYMMGTEEKPVCAVCVELRRY